MCHDLHMYYYYTFQLIQEQSDKICEMAAVMNKAIQLDEKTIHKEEELLSRLTTENKVCTNFYQCW